jgi:hypothetical protein
MKVQKFLVKKTNCVPIKIILFKINVLIIFLVLLCRVLAVVHCLCRDVYILGCFRVVYVVVASACIL